MAERAPLRLPLPRPSLTVAAPAEAPAIPWAAILLAVLGLRLLLTVIGAGMVLLLPQAHQSYGLQALLLDPWRQFDANWFTGIAQHGYGAGDGSTAYLPLYPLLIRLAAVLTLGHYLLAALLVSNLCCLLAMGLIWRWSAERFTVPVAWRTVVLLLAFPDAFYLLGAYSESLFLALCAGSLLALRHERPLLAGLLAALATLTRLQGLTLVVPLLWACWPRRRSPAALAAGLIGACLPGLALLAYQRLLSARLGGADVFGVYQRWWHLTLQTPVQTIWQYVEKIRSPEWHLFHSPRANYVLLWDLLIGLAVLAVLVAGSRQIGWELTLFGLAGWCFAMTRWLSTGRYMLAILPFFVVLALWTDDRRRYRRLILGSLVLLVFFAAEFAQGSWVD